jgi:hypothetical protein
MNSTANMQSSEYKLDRKLSTQKINLNARD